MNIKEQVEKYLKLNLGTNINAAYFDGNSWIRITRQADNSKKIIDFDTLYDIASLTKTFTATQIALLIQNKVLNLDDKINKFLPFLKSFNTTIEELLQHRSGLIYTTPIDKSKEYTSSTLKDIFFNSNNIKLTNPGKTKYNDLNYIYLGQILENITDSKLDKLLDKFATKYRIKSISYYPKNYDSFCKTHSNQEKIIPHDEKAKYWNKALGHAGIFANTEGLLKYISLWLGNGFELNKNLYNKSFGETTKYEKFENYGLVWRHGRYSFQDGVFNHAGFTGPSVFINPTKKRALIHTCNYTYSNFDTKKRKQFVKWNSHFEL